MDKPHVVELEGPPRRRGQVHGETLRSVIGETVGRWRDRVGEATGLSLEDYAAWLRANTGFERAAGQWTPWLIEEVAGIGQGAGLSPEIAWAWQMLDEHGWLYERCRRQRGRGGDPGPGEQACSSLGVAGRPGQPNLIAQNLDLPPIKQGCQTVLRVRGADGEADLLLVTQAGAVASMGVNSRGLGVCVNTLSQLAPSADGLPVSFVVRGLLAQGELHGARNFLARVTHASGQNYLFASPAGVLDFECSAAGAVQVEAVDGRPIACHTNHPLASMDLTAAAAAPGAASVGGPCQPASSSYDRLELLRTRVVDPGWPATVAAARTLLATHPLCVGLEQGCRVFTAACVIIELARTPVMHVSAGPPDCTPLHSFTF